MTASVRLSAKHAKTLAELLSDFDVDDKLAYPYQREAVATLRRALKPRPTSSAKKKTAAKRRTKREATSAIYEQVAERAGGKCEACSAAFSPFPYASTHPELDHFRGRARANSVESCWMLCAYCHRAKSASRPSASAWLERFIAHCERHGYTAEADRARARLHGIVAMRAGGAR